MPSKRPAHDAGDVRDELAELGIHGAYPLGAGFCAAIASRSAVHAQPGAD